MKDTKAKKGIKKEGSAPITMSPSNNNNTITCYVDAKTESYNSLYHVLDDGHNTDKWRDKKIKSLQIAESYERLGDRKRAMNIKYCGTDLLFKHFEDNSIKLHQANFCKSRLCPMCSWRRSMKIFHQLSQVMNVAVSDTNNDFLFLTLTVKNCKGVDLSKTIDVLLDGYNHLFRLKAVKDNVIGAFRALEVTHNTNRYSSSYDTFHPHLHVVLMVNKEYFNKHKGNYITQKQWSEMWKQSIKAEYKPIVHIEKIKEDSKNITKAVLETAKYTVKDTDIIDKDRELQDKTVAVLDVSLAGRRLISYRGILLKIAKQLKLDTEHIDDDLIHCGDDELRTDVNYVIDHYTWNVGYYVYVDSIKPVEDN